MDTPFVEVVKLTMPDVLGGIVNWSSPSPTQSAPNVRMVIDANALRFYLRGAVKSYIRPTDPVGEDDWETLVD